MNIREFADELVTRLENVEVDRYCNKEDTFEHAFLTPTAWKLAMENPDIFLCLHRADPDDNETCTPNCKDAHEGKGTPEMGCKRCWSDSKHWGEVQTHGFRNAFDMVAIDSEDRTLAVEAKLLKPDAWNTGWQRSLGQCLLAAAIHDVVIGVFGHIGKIKEGQDRNTEQVEKVFQDLGIQLVFMEVPEV